MTFSVGHVSDGTRAGWRKIKPAPKNWIHVCSERPLAGGRELAAAYKRCPDCGTRRP